MFQGVFIQNKYRNAHGKSTHNAINSKKGHLQDLWQRSQVSHDLQSANILAKKQHWVP